MNTNLPLILESRLSEFRRRVWMVKLGEGVGAGLVGLAVSYLLVFGLDRVCETPWGLRLGILLLGSAVLAIGLPLKWHAWVWRQRRLEDAARLLRRSFPRLGDQLLGIVELTRREHAAAAGQSERLVQAAIAQAAEAVKGRDFTQAVPDPRHRQWGWAAAGALGVVGLGFLVAGDASSNAFLRWIAPWRATERFTFTRIEPLPKRLVVPYAEPFALPVYLRADTRWAPATGQGAIHGQAKVSAGLAQGVYPLAFPPQKQDGALALSVGDARQTVLVQPRTRPDLTEVTVHERLPAYLGYKTEQEIKVSGGAVSVLRGAEAAFAARASRAVTHAEMDGQPQQTRGAEIMTGYSPVTGDAERKFTWKDADGLTPREPLKLQVKAVEDEPPAVMARRQDPEEVVLDSEVVNFDATASDDFGVKAVGLEWVGSQMMEDGTTPVHGEKVSAAGGPEKREVQAPVTFCATREGVAPQTVEVRVWTEDYLPGRSHAHSAAFTLHVLNKTDHAMWLTEQFGKWLESAKESYEKEQQLHQANKELRALSPAELDRPENRRRVEQQAAAEMANAARLDGLTRGGRNLVKQGMKNDEFDAKRLESWATMLKSLEEIAAQRMPNVSDLLKQTASAAPGAQRPGAAGAPKPGAQPAASPGAMQATNGKTAPSVAHGSGAPGMLAPPPPLDANAKPKQPAPRIADREQGFNKPGEAPTPNPNAPPKAPGTGKLRLPTTTLDAVASKTPGETPPAPPQSPAQQKMDGAIGAQADLLAEFAKVSDQLGDILASLEASTFVKRFKAASRQQMAIATNLSQKTLDSFGLERKVVEAARPIAKTAKDQSEVVRVIQSDLNAYYERKQDARYKRILDDMNKTEIVKALAHDSDKVTSNLSGQSLIGSEFWSDTLDRWAEELVAASNCKSSSTCSGDSLPPEIVLKVMQALRDEMKLRDETRETENAKAAVDADKHARDAGHLGETQGAIGLNTVGAMEDIKALPDGPGKFPKEIQLLQEVVGVMNEAQGILNTPETGPQAIAAETEAIELLLQAKRSGKGGGGGGANPGGGGRAAAASSAALADLGDDAEVSSRYAARTVGQETGKAGREFPEEFKSGLDTYFNLLEKQGNGP